MIIITLKDEGIYDAGSKIPTDVIEFLRASYGSESYILTKEKGILKKFKTRIKLLKILAKARIRGEILVLQFPMDFLLKDLRFFLKINLINQDKLIINLRSLTSIEKSLSALTKEEKDVLTMVKSIVVPTVAIKKYLEKNEIKAKISVYDFFDIVCNKKLGYTRNYKTLNKQMMKVACIGDFSKKENSFVYQLKNWKLKFDLLLYGTGINQDINTKIKFYNEKSENSISDNLNADFGLIWKGNFDESDFESKEKILFRHNNFIELSFFVAAGIPVITWEKSAIAQIIKKYDIGYVIKDIYEINNLDFEDYKEKFFNVQKLQTSIREGENISKVIEKAVIDMEDKNMQEYDYLIVGAGLFGSVFANEATKRGKQCLVIDKRSHIGGNIYTDCVEGINVHKYGPHVFHTNNKKAWDYINQFCEFNRYTHSVVACSDEKMYNLPLNMNTFNRLWGINTPSDAIKKIELEQKKSFNAKNFEEQALSKVGATVYNKFFSGYIEKKYGKKPKDLPPNIEKIEVKYNYDNNVYNDKFQGIPIGGYTKIIEKMLSGCEVRLGFDYFENLESLDGLAFKTIYTGRIDEYFGYKYGELEYTSCNYETEIINTKNYQGSAVINFLDMRNKYTRSIEHKHFEFGDQPNTVVSREQPVKCEKNRIPFYPIVDDKNIELFGKYFELTKGEKNVFFGGRMAKFKNCSMDEIIVDALNLADKLKSEFKIESFNDVSKI